VSVASLRSAAAEFAAQLNHVIVSAVDTAERFGVDLSRDGAVAVGHIAPTGDPDSYGMGLLRSCDGDDCPALFLRAKFTVEMDADHAYLRVVSSAIGLRVDVTGGRRQARPIVRVEFDRRQLQPGRAAAHVHLHANSPELAWVYGTSAQPAPDLHALHFPAGGRRFRPTLEEFLLFLDRERLFNDWKDGWKPKLIRSLEAWERLQARATVRQFPDEAAGALEALGYSVTAPTAGASG